MVPPFKPAVTNDADTSNVDTTFTREVPLVTPTPADAVLVDEDAFEGFTYEGSYVMQSVIDGEHYMVSDDIMEVDWEEESKG